MLTYYLDMALRSCRRSKALTALVVVLMGLRVLLRSRRLAGRSGQGPFGRRPGRPEPEPEDDASGRGFFGGPPAS